MIKIRIKLFGFLQDCCKDEVIEINASQGITIRAVKQKLLSYFGDVTNDRRLQNLPENCVLADENEILFDEVKLNEDANLAVLPPVCGG